MDYKNIKGHENLEGDINQCPFMKDKNNNTKEQPKNNVKEKKIPKDKEESETESDTEILYRQKQGGCPVMNSKYNILKNPPLEPYEENFSVPYVSPYKFLLGYKGMYLNSNEELKFDKWNGYPIYLKHTVLIKDENISKIRNLELGHIYFIFDELREKGNKRFHRKRYQRALEYYEKAMSLIYYIECKIEENVPLFPKYDFQKINENNSEYSSDEKSNYNFDNNEKLVKEKINLENSFQTKNENESKDMKFDEKTKLMLTTFHDGNTKLYYKEKYDGHDVEMYDSMLVSIFMNISSCYMKLYNYEDAKNILIESKKLSQENSLVNYKLSQAISKNLDSNLKELNYALECINISNESYKKEKIFENTTNLLNMLNIQNYKEEYENEKKYVLKRIKEREEFEGNLIYNLLQREFELREITKRMINEGKVPEESEEFGMMSLFNNDIHFERNIIKNVLKKYDFALEFYLNGKERQNFILAKKEIQRVKKSSLSLRYYWDLNYKDLLEDKDKKKILKEKNKEFNLDLENLDEMKRIEKIQREKGRELFESVEFNYELYEHVIEDYVKENKNELSEEENINNNQVNEKSDYLKYYLRISFIITLIIGIGIYLFLLK